jgi:hypothetical protein
MNEKQFWKRCVEPILRGKGHYDRIESHATATGRPDVNVCFNGGGPTWDIELKNWGSRRPEIRPAQRRWFHERVKAGGLCCVLMRIEGPTSVHTDWFGFIPSEKILDMPDRVANRHQWKDMATHQWWETINANELLEVLLNA